MKRLIVGLLLAASTCAAQTPEPPKFYKLDFVVKEIEGGKTLNARNYSTILSTKGRPSSIRAGSRVPVPSAPGSSQWTYLEVGVNIDCNLPEEVAGELFVPLTVDITSIPQDAATSVPVLRSNKWTSTVVVPLKKPTLVYSSDDPTSKRQMQLELTASPVK